MKTIIAKWSGKFQPSKKIYTGAVVDLKQAYQLSESEAYDGVPCVFYDILLHGSKTKVGSIDLRFKMDDRMYYYGHVGYGVALMYRGHNYAYWACKRLFDIARHEYGIKELIITCNPDNVASYKTLIKLDGEYLGVVDVPIEHELYRKNERRKCIFRYEL